MKLLSVVLIFLGELLAIYAELAAAQSAKEIGGIALQPFTMNLLIMTLGGVCLIFGYMSGVIAFGSAWTVAVISIVGIFIIEPPLVYSLFKTLPNRGEVIGFICGVIGMFATLFIGEG